MPGLCPFKDIFGKPKTGLHSIRVFDVAVVDVVLTVVAGVLIATYFKWNVYVVVIALFLLGILMHRLFCVNTTLNVALGLGIPHTSELR